MGGYDGRVDSLRQGLKSKMAIYDGYMQTGQPDAMAGSAGDDGTVVEQDPL